MQADAISRSAVLKIITCFDEQVSSEEQTDEVAFAKRIGSLQTLVALRYRVDDLPALDVAPVVHARWVVKRMAGETIALQCSACRNNDNPSKVRGNYCWNCGAKMDGDA